MKMQNLILVLALLPAVSATTFTEVMYNPLGSDSGREWIELGNDELTDYTGYKLFEQGTNHNLVLFQGSSTLEPGEFAIITRDAQEFLAEYNYTGTLFESSFSLRNDGEEIAISDSGFNIVAHAIYGDNANEGFSVVPIGNTSVPSNWVEGEFGGTPGEPENHQVPEFNAIGLALAALISTIIIRKK